MLRHVIPVLLVAQVLSGCLAPTADDAGAGADPLALTCPAPCASALPVPAGYVWEPHGVGNPADPAHYVVGFKDADRGLHTLVTRDGGASWDAGHVPVGEAAPDASPLAAYTYLGDPVLAIGPDGTVYYAGLAGRYEESRDTSTRDGSSVFVARSTDGGVTFPDVTVVAEGAGRYVHARPAPSGVTAQWENHDKEWIAVGADGTLLVVWSAVRSEAPISAGALPLYRNDLLAATSKDGGRSWSKPATIASGPSLTGAFPVVTEGGTMHVAYRHMGDGALFVGTSWDGGASWKSRAVADDAGGQPVLRAVPESRGLHLHLAYPAGPEKGPQTPALAESRDGGATWTAPRTLTGAHGGEDAHVAMDIAPDGNLLVAWYRATGSDADAPLDYLVAAVSGNETGSPVALAQGLPGPASAFGDYVVGLHAIPGGALVTWVEPAADGHVLAFARVVASA